MSNKKFMAGAVTAAMVATAVVPAVGAEEVKANEFSDVSVNHTHGPNIFKALELGFMTGYVDGTFKPEQTLTRSNVVKALGKYWLATNGETLESYDYEGITPFNDVPETIGDKELYNYSLIVKNEGIFDGSNNNLMPLQNITRQQMAKVLVNAFDLKDLPGVDSKVTDNDEAFDEFVPYINILSENGVTQVTEFMPMNTAKRGQYASFLIRAHEASTGVVTPEPEVMPAISAVNATGPSTAVITGTDLTELAEADVEIEGEEITGFTPAANGTSIAVTIEGAFTPGEEYTLVATIDGEEEEFTFTYAGEVAGDDLAITTTVLDDDMDEQYITFNLGGLPADIDYLTNVLGYDVEFQAEAGANVFETGTNVSETGEINKDAIEINYEFDVKVVLKKGGEVTESEWVTVNVINMNATPAIGDLAVRNITTDTILNSDTLVIGEAYEIPGITSETGQIIGISGDEVYSSSNEAVALVNRTTGEITPIAPGTVTITATAGDQSNSVTLNVTNEERELATVNISPESVKLAPGVTREVAVEAYDQYGDEFAITSANIVESTTLGSDITTGDVTAEGTLAITAGDTAGDYSVFLRDEDDEELLGTISVEVTEGNTVDTSKTILERDPSGGLALNVNEYTVDGGFVRTATSSPESGSSVTVGTESGVYTVEVVDEDVASLSITADDNGRINVLGLENGTTGITVTLDGVLLDTYDVTINQTELEVLDVNFQAVDTVIAAGVEIDAYDVLDIDEVDFDDIVNGIELNIVTSSFVRIDDDGNIYLDVNDDGINNDGEAAALGSLELNSSDLDVEGNSFTTAAGDEGTLVFSFVEAGEDGDVLASTTVNVDVPDGAVTNPTP